jgi:3-polyprenyl-4-hydroxybenzoate decarboxylase/SAM-dependent methyltransferase
MSLVCADSPRVMSGPGGVWFLGAGDACLLEGDSGELVLAVLEHATTPSTAEAIVAAVAQAAGVDAGAVQPIRDAVALLVRTGALIDDTDRAPPALPVTRRAGNVVVGVTGAIGAIHAPSLVQQLLAATHDVRVVMTRSARRFISRRVFEAITQRPVVTSLWSGSPRAPAPHVELAQWADVVVVYPCTASSLARIAAADCSELVSAVATTTRAPVLLVPSMNTEMFRAPLVTQNLDRLREHGFFIAHPGHGHEVAEAPSERVLRMGVAAPAAHVVRYVDLLLERAASGGPKLPSRAEWSADHERRAVPEHDPPVDPDVARALHDHAAQPSRVLDVGTGFGEVARAAARSGHTVVATDFSEVAIERAHSIDPSLPVTWLVDDMAETALRGSFDLCIDRACFGCISVARRERYIASIAALVQPGGIWLLKVHRAPLSTLRAHGFTEEEVTELMAPWFETLSARESLLSFGASGDRPAWTFELQRRREGPA